ncbi:MAG: hypothetical protein Q8Q67_00030 [bacterium]|nr:hypothetical protein [bacterium]
MLEGLIIVLIIVNIYFYIDLKKTKKKINVLTFFIDGLISFCRKVPGQIVWVNESKDGSAKKNIEEYGHDYIYNYIKDSFENGYWIKPYEKFLKEDKDLFQHEDFVGGFINYFEYVHNKLNLEQKAFEEEQKKKIDK